MDINKSIKKFNQRKTESEKKFLYAFGFIALSIIIVIILVNQSTSENLMIIPLLTAIPGLVFVIMGAVGFSKVKKSFKNDFLSAIFDELIPGIIYKPERGLSKTIVYETEFLKRADRFHTEDYLEGKIDDIDFVSSDVKLEERRVRHTKNGTQTYYVPYFVGRVFRFDFHKELVGHLQVLENGRPVSKRRFKKIQLESIDFNKKFKVYSEEDLTAFYILTPDIMEAIFAIEKRHPGNIKFSFSDQQMYLGINNNRNTFELKLFRKLSEEAIQSFKNDLLVVKDVIHTLKLNNNIFKKKEA